MVTVAKAEAPAEFFLVLDSAVIKALSKFSHKVPTFKAKVFPVFVGNFVKEVAMRAQKDIIDFLSRLKDVDRIMKMEVDQIVEAAQGTSEERKSLTDNTSLLAKSLELLALNEAAKPAIEELVSTGANLRYLSKLIKLDASSYTASIEAITSCFCESLVQALNPASAPLDALQSAECLTTVTSLLLAALSLSKGNSQETKSVAKPVLAETVS